MPSFALLDIAHEQWHAWKVSRRALRAFWDVCGKQAALPDTQLYEKVVSRLSDLTAESPEQIVMRARESFATWPTSRSLRLRDVAHYVAYSSYVSVHSNAHGTRSDMRRMVEFVIQETL